MSKLEGLILYNTGKVEYIRILYNGYSHKYLHISFLLFPSHHRHINLFNCFINHHKLQSNFKTRFLQTDLNDGRHRNRSWKPRTSTRVI